MTYYKVITPYQVRRFTTKQEAEAFCHSGLDRIAAKRGYKLLTETKGAVTYWRVFNSKGCQTTGARIIKCQGELTNPDFWPPYRGPLSAETFNSVEDQRVDLLLKTHKGFTPTA